MEFKFKTDIDVKNNLDEIPILAPSFAWAMMTSLWGGNEISVLAVIRALAIADLGVSVNRKEMVQMLDGASEMIAETVRDFHDQMRKRGFDVQIFPPTVTPPDTRS